MFLEPQRKPLFTPGVRAYRVIRVSLAVMSVAFIGMGTFALSARGLPDVDGRLGFGLVNIVFGTACMLVAWRGRWRPAETEPEKAYDALVTRRMQPFIDGAELLFLSLALVGVMMPARFGSLWIEHRSSLALFGVLIAVDFGRRFRRRRAAHLLAEQSAGSNSQSE